MALKGRIVSYAHRYRRPPKKRKPVALKMPAVICSSALRDRGSIRQHRLMATSGGRIPTVYQGQRFPSRAALAKYLAPRCGKTPSTLMTLLFRYAGDVERAIAPHPSRKPRTRIPIFYQAQRFSSRAALAKYLAPRCGKTFSTLMTLLSRYDGDVERALAAHPSPQRRSFTFEGQVFATRKALAVHLAPRLSRSFPSIERLLVHYHDDIAKVLAARSYAPRPRLPRRSPVPSHAVTSRA